MIELRTLTSGCITPPKRASLAELIASTSAALRPDARAPTYAVVLSVSQDCKTDAVAAVKAALTAELELARDRALCWAVLLLVAWPMRRKLPVMVADSRKVMLMTREEAAPSLLSVTSYCTWYLKA